VPLVFKDEEGAKIHLLEVITKHQGLPTALIATTFKKPLYGGWSPRVTITRSLLMKMKRKGLVRSEKRDNELCWYTADYEKITATPGHYCKHRKGGIYLILYLAEHTDTSVELVIYQEEKENGQVWARPRDRFEDGRFEDLGPAVVEIIDIGVGRVEISDD